MTTVHFVGAGPGAEDLITLRGKALIESADVIIYAGSLVSPALLKYAKNARALFNSAEMTLDEITETARNASAQGKTVVRLHSGDPCLYGALREQADRLTALGIPFDICPGVPSFCAAAAALKAEYTLPGVSQTVILTRAAGKAPVPEKEAISLLAAHGASMVLFLSAGMLENVSKELTKGGLPPETPAAIVYKASRPEEKIVRCAVSELAEKAAENNIGKTALVCVGRFLGGDYELSKLYSAVKAGGNRSSGAR